MTAEAIGIRDGRIAAIGSFGDVHAALPDATVRRLEGGAILPAFTDPHLHAFLVAADPFVDVLAGSTSIAELLARVRRHVSAAPAGESWLRYHGYLPLDLAEHRSPTVAELDAICPDRPLHVLTRTFHESVVNSAGLAALGITRGTADPAGGEIVRDRRGKPTGVLIESASFAAEAASRPDDPAAWATRLAAFGRQLLEQGIVRVGDAAVPQPASAAFVQTLADAGVEAHPLLVGATIDTPAQLDGQTAKVLVDGGERCDFYFTNAQLGRLMRAAVASAFGPDAKLARAVSGRGGRIRRGPRGWQTGLRLTDAPRLDQLMRSAAETGGSLALHAVGNGAVMDVVSAVERNPAAAVRIEHALTLDPELARQLAGTGRPVVTQPGFLRSHSRQLVTVPVPAPMQLMPLRTLVDHGAPVAFGSDYPAAELSPWPAIAAAVSRRSGSDGRGPLVEPDQALSLAQALDACTQAAAGVLGVTDSGTLAVGQRADLQWVDRDPYAVADTRDLAGIGTREVWAGGTPMLAD